MKQQFLKEIKPQLLKLLELAEREKLTSLEFSRGEIALSFKKNGKPVLSEPELLETQEGKLVVLADRVGEFHFSSPENPVSPLKTGDKVQKGQILGFIESVSLYYEITAPAGGKLEKVLVTEGEVVEYGKPLWEIKV